MLRTTTTPAFKGPRGEALPSSIAEAAYLQLGGVDQWVMIRGEDVANPVLILLHGGPGFSETAMFRTFNAPLERHFTVVYWDQRGAGKSYDPATPRASMTVAQFLADLDELVDTVRKRLGVAKVTIFGHSWGAALGVLYTARFPAKVAVYVGSGQIGDAAAGERLSYQYAVEEATRRHRRLALRALRKIGPPPHGARELMTERTWVQVLDGQLGLRGLWAMGKLIFAAPESSVRELPAAIRGFRFTLEAMWAEVSALDLARAVPALQVPVFVLLARKDHWVPPEATLAYVDALTAPSKTLIWFEESGHEPFMDEPDKFNRTMIEVVRPAVVAALAAPS